MTYEHDVARSMRAYEVYSGVGGMGIGFEAAGIRIVGSRDIWDRVSAVRAFNEMTYGDDDASDIFPLASKLLQSGIELIIGGPPCQEFSKSGKREAGDNAALTRAFALLVSSVMPEWFVYENVVEAVDSYEFQDARTVWKRAGYGLSELVLDASYYDVAQARKRAIVVGRRGEADGFLNEALLSAKSKTQKVVRDILDPRDPDDKKLLEVGYYYSRAFASGAGVHSIDEPANGINHTFRQPPYGKHKTLINPKDAIHATEAHVLTQAQMSRLQGFPRSFKWEGYFDKPSIEDVDQMIANALPPALAYHIAKAVRERHEGGIPKLDSGFKKWLEDAHGLVDRANSNVRTRVNRCRRLLGGRTYPTIYRELEALEALPEFMALDIRLQSDLRAALKLYASMPRTVESFHRDLPTRKGLPLRFKRGRHTWRPKWTFEELLLKPQPLKLKKLPSLNATSPDDDKYIPSEPFVEPYPDDPLLFPPKRQRKRKKT